MPKGLNKVNVSIGFTADTKQAKREIENLYQSLSKLSTAKDGDAGITAFSEKIEKGNLAAMQLQASLRDAFNVDTGKLDLSKFSSSLERSGLQLDTLRNDLINIGPAGEKAFLGLAKFVAQAEIPTFQLNKTLASV